MADDFLSWNDRPGEQPAWRAFCKGMKTRQPAARVADSELCGNRNGSGAAAGKRVAAGKSGRAATESIPGKRLAKCDQRLAQGVSLRTAQPEPGAVIRAEAFQELLPERNEGCDYAAAAARSGRQMIRPYSGCRSDHHRIRQPLARAPALPRIWHGHRPGSLARATVCPVRWRCPD